jgi:ketosteroid isomerase-like protein
MNSTINDSGIVVAAGRTERASGVGLVRDFLDALTRRDLAAANASLGGGFRMHVPGGEVCRSLEDFAAFGRKRYAAVRKNIDGIEACDAPVGVAVYACGTMSGQWLDGTSFEGVRYCDRFLVRDGKILEMQEWNDLGEFRPR